MQNGFLKVQLTHKQNSSNPINQGSLTQALGTAYLQSFCVCIILGKIHSFAQKIKNYYTIIF